MTDTPANVQKYINRIRNLIKRQYAKDYWLHLNGSGQEPDRPKDLSAMAAQSVRMELAQYYQ